MSETKVRQVCALLRDGCVLTDEEGRLPSYEAEDTWDDPRRRAHACGDPAAVLVAPQIMVGSDPTVLLSVFGPRSETTVDGTWRSLDDLVGGDPALLPPLREIAAITAGVIEAPARRPQWFSTSWYDEADAWVDAQLGSRGRTRTGATVPTKVWSVSAVLMIPSDPAPVWMKASCRHFHAEPALTRLVAEMMPEHAPPMLAADEERAWLLMDDLPGATEEREDPPPPGLALAAARITATLQLRSLDHLVAIEAAGVPVRTLTDTRHRFDQLLGDSVELVQLTPEELAAARALRGDVHAVLDELAGLGIPDTLVHGDLHAGNVAHDGEALVLYDWSDAAISHPFLDVVLLTQEMPDDERKVALRAYEAAWRTAYPHVDVARGLGLAHLANTIYQMVTFEEIYRSQEDASYWEMRGVVARMLRDLPGRFPGLDG